MIYASIHHHTIMLYYFSWDVLHPSGPHRGPLSSWEAGGGSRHSGGDPRQEGRLDRHPPPDPGRGPGETCEQVYCREHYVYPDNPTNNNFLIRNWFWQLASPTDNWLIFLPGDDTGHGPDQLRPPPVPDLHQDQRWPRGRSPWSRFPRPWTRCGIAAR